MKKYIIIALALLNVATLFLLYKEKNEEKPVMFIDDKAYTNYIGTETPNNDGNVKTYAVPKGSYKGYILEEYNGNKIFTNLIFVVE